LVALSENGRPAFWGECGHVGLRKVLWLAKHSGAHRIALFKFDIAARHFIAQVREEVAARYRPAGRITLFNFDPVVLEEAGTEITRIPEHWYETHDI
jgi:hypothetical protein